MKKFRKFQFLAGCVCTLAILASAARAAERDTPERDGRFVAVTAGEAISAGHMVAVLPADGEAYAADDTATLAVVGRAENTAAEGETVIVKRGVFRWTNLGGFDAGDIGTTCYVTNSTSVCAADGVANDVPAGIIQDVDTSGVWVDTYNDTLELTSTVAALTVSGNAAVGGTLAVTGASTLTGNTAVVGTLTATGATTLNGGLTMDTDKFTVANTTGNTAIGGTLAVTGVTTLTAPPKFTALTAAAAVTATATNAPALAAAAAPKWITVTIGTNTCVVPAYVLQ